MLFNSYEFIFAFLPIVLVLYYALRSNQARLLMLSLASYLFYGWWDFRFCGLMFLTTVIDYYAALGISRARTPRGRRGWLLVSVVSGLSLLGFFKYYGLMAHTANGLAGWFHGGPVQLLPELQLILPIGISFYTFHSMSYAIDVYRGAVQPARSFINFACFVSLFSQLVAGPIIRYRDLAEQLVARVHTADRAVKGISFFIVGLGKKVILADGVAPLVDHAFSAQAPGFASAWIGVLSYTMQIYFDFSGYSDMAVGLGHLFGFQIPQNFNSPYKADSITEFWRRWHISLSTWLRDYLYIPLGGNRNGPGRTYFNLILTMFLGGLWHGANWTFALWGIYHGTLLAIERAAGKKSFLAKAPAPIRIAFTFLLVLVGWIFFRCPTVGQAIHIMSGLVGLNGAGWVELNFAAEWPLAMPALPVAIVIVWATRNSWQMKHEPGLLEAAWLAILFLVCLAVILVNTSSPFLYFQF